MPTVPIGWATDIAVLEHGGSRVENCGDHLVVSTPRNPTYHRGNCLFVTDPDAVDDAARWVQAFRDTFPSAGWIAIGLTRMPDDQAAWTEQGVELELDDVLATTSLPLQKALPAGYTVQQLMGGDWEQVVARAMAENDRSGEYEPQSHEGFVRARAQSQRGLTERDVAAFFGAFAGDLLVAELGIVRCGTTGRYQSVGTDAEHRERGLASHLLGVAARWAADHGCNRWVIMTEATNPAGRVYRSLGFEPTTGNAQAYRRPPR